jgi:hypothetical protein
LGTVARCGGLGRGPRGAVSRNAREEAASASSLPGAVNLPGLGQAWRGLRLKPPSWTADPEMSRVPLRKRSVAHTVGTAQAAGRWHIIPSAPACWPRARQPSTRQQKALCKRLACIGLDTLRAKREVACLPVSQNPCAPTTRHSAVSIHHPEGERGGRATGRSKETSTNGTVDSGM